MFPALKRWAIANEEKFDSSIRAIRVIRGRKQLLDGNGESKLLVDRVALNCRFDFNTKTKTIARPVRLRSGRAQRPIHLTFQMI
jgi:hypothetical protein